MSGREVSILINAKDNATPAFDHVGHSAHKLIRQFNQLQHMVMGGIGGFGIHAITHFGIESVKAFAESGKEGEKLKKVLEGVAETIERIRAKAGKSLIEGIFGPDAAKVIELLTKSAGVTLGVEGRDAINAFQDRAKDIDLEQLRAGFGVGNGGDFIKKRRDEIRAIEAEMDEAREKMGDPRLRFLNVEMQKRINDGVEAIRLIEQELDNAVGAGRQERINARGDRAGPLDPLLHGIFAARLGFRDMVVDGVNAMEAIEKKMDDMLATELKVLEVRKKGDDALQTMGSRLRDVDPMIRAAAEVELKAKSRDIRNVINPGRQFAIGLSEVQAMHNRGFLNEAEAAAVRAHMEEGRARSVFGGGAMIEGGRLQNDAMEGRGLTFNPITQVNPELKSLNDIVKELQIQKKWQDEMLRAIKADPAKAQQILEIRNQLG